LKIELANIANTGKPDNYLVNVLHNDISAAVRVSTESNHNNCALSTQAENVKFPM
jgi:hypothetical protein